MPTAYIAGPMRGRPFFGFPAFDAAKKHLLEIGYNVISPADLDRECGFDPFALDPQPIDWNILPPTFSVEEAFDRDVEAIKKSDYVCLLPGWENSVGAKAEYSIALWLGKKLINCDGSDYISPVAATAAGETIMVDAATGGQKGQKLERFDLIPVEPLEELARVYGRGAKKYADDNWRRGYSWKLSYGAMMRHAVKFWKGEQCDEIGNHHLACVAWHCFTMMWYEQHNKGTDDRADKPIS